MEGQWNSSSTIKWISLAGLAGIIFLAALQKCSESSDLAYENARLKAKAKILNGNIVALKDTMEYWKDSDGNSRSEISLLTADKELLKNQFKDLKSKYKEVIGKDAEDLKMIAYLNSQIQIKEREISDLKSSAATSGSRIINDSTIAIEVGKQYDTLNSYSVTGTVQTNIS